MTGLCRGCRGGRAHGQDGHRQRPTPVTRICAARRPRRAGAPGGFRRRDLRSRDRDVASRIGVDRDHRAHREGELDADVRHQEATPSLPERHDPATNLSCWLGYRFPGLPPGRLAVGAGVPTLPSSDARMSGDPIRLPAIYRAQANTYQGSRNRRGCLSYRDRRCWSRQNAGVARGTHQPASRHLGRLTCW